MRAARTSTLRVSAARSAPCSTRGTTPSAIDTPTITRKNGNTRSVGVQPFHSACSSGAYTWLQVPGLLTSSMAATVMPRSASTDAKRVGVWLDGELLMEGIPCGQVAEAGRHRIEKRLTSPSVC